MWGSAGTNSPGPAPPKTALSRTAPARVSDDQNASSRDRGRRSVRPALALARSRTDHARTAPRLYTGRIYCATLKVISNAKSVKQNTLGGLCSCEALTASPKKADPKRDRNGLEHRVSSSNRLKRRVHSLEPRERVVAAAGGAPAAGGATATGSATAAVVCLWGGCGGACDTQRRANREHGFAVPPRARGRRSPRQRIEAERPALTPPPSCADRRPLAERASFEFGTSLWKERIEARSSASDTEASSSSSITSAPRSGPLPPPPPWPVAAELARPAWATPHASATAADRAALSAPSLK